MAEEWPPYTSIDEFTFGRNFIDNQVIYRPSTNLEDEAVLRQKLFLVRELRRLVALPVNYERDVKPSVQTRR